MDCDALAWYEKQDEALQTRIHMLACFTANLEKGDWRQLLPGACRGARDDRIIFDAIVDMLIAPFAGRVHAPDGHAKLAEGHRCFDERRSFLAAPQLESSRNAIESCVRDAPAAHLWQAPRKW